MTFFFATAFLLASRGRLDVSPRMLKIALWSLPLPWVAIECGWLVAEYGRQPWVIEGVLPTYYAASGLTLADLAISLAVFLVLYTALLVIGVVRVLVGGLVAEGLLTRSAIQTTNQPDASILERVLNGLKAL